ncbi:kinase-like domain-containing protein [Cadophora sp. MPI-SDFR-AT-0126]|nr:kinase-like domain-containing protein [Leotiomycetes sp. MPI-SDFR-AT-0126]
MEVVGVVASVVTLTQLVIEGVKLAKTLYAAPDDLVALQEQLENFSTLVQEIDRSQGEGTDSVVTQSLTRAKLSIEQLHQLIQIKLLKNLDGGRSRAHRRAWARNKSKILVLRDVLKECRDNLSVALSAKNSSSSAQNEMRLAVIVQETGQSRQSLTTIDTRLSEIQQSLELTQRAIDAQSHSLGHILTSVSTSVTATRFGQSGPQVTWPARTGFLASNLEMRRSHSYPPSPAGMFELSGNFFPEIYTTHKGPSTVPTVIYSAFEEYSNGTYRSNHYQLFFLKTQRQWRRLSLTLIVNRGSKYWDYTKLSTTKVTFENTSYNLPRILQDKLEELLWGMEELYQDTHLSLTISEQVSPETGLPWNHVCIRKQLPETERAGRDLISNLDHLGCRRYNENEVVQVARLDNARALVVFVNNRLLFESRITKLSEDFALYTIHVLHCLQGTPGVAKFAGVVIDSGGQQVKSFLREIPIKGWIDRVIADGIDQGTGLSWSRCERWAQDIVEAVSHIHSKGFVIGALGDFAYAPIAIDSKDRAVLCSFRDKTWADNSLPGHLPPELRTKSSPNHPRAYSMPQTEHLDVTPHCDIFQLGALLWLLACGQKPRRWRHCCYYAGCLGMSICMEHANMIDMPPLPASVPQYYIDMIALCRSPDPLKRPTARSLLQLFPVSTDYRDAQAEIPTEVALAALIKEESSVVSITCDSCEDVIPTTVFHCNICDGGDYDLCAECMGNGAHCNDPTHFLVEMEMKGALPLVTNNYYSSVKQSGDRKLMHL